MLPIIIPTQESLSSIEPLFHRAVEIRKHISLAANIDDRSVEELRNIEETIDGFVEHLYLLNSNHREVNRQYYPTEQLRQSNAIKKNDRTHKA